MTEFPRSLPVLNEDTKAFWTGGATGELRIYRCQSCLYYVHPPVMFCPQCEGRDVVPERVSGKGIVKTFTVNHKAWVPGLKVPYVLALVSLDEQPEIQLPANIIGCPVGSVHIGLHVKVQFEQCEDIWIPLFTPSEA